MHKSVVLFLVLVSTISVAPQGFIPQGFGFNHIPILSAYSEAQLDGSFRYSYETGNGIQVQTQGLLKPVPVVRPDGVGRSLALVQSGSYSYTAPDGTLIEVRWTADEKGFHPQVIQIPAPIPPGGSFNQGLPAGLRFKRMARRRIRNHD